MGLALAARDRRAARLLQLASQACGVDLVRAIERGSRALGRTEVVQPALVAIGLAVARALEARGVRVDVVAGHSLGELTAVAFACDLSDEEAVALAAERGRAMAQAAAARPGGMIAVRAADARAIAAGLEVGLALAAHNAPDEWVLSGPEQALAAGLAAIAAPAVRLRVGGAWHSPAMAAVVAVLRARCAALVANRRPRMPIVSAIEAREVGAAEIVEALASGPVRTVRWVEALRAVGARGIEQVLVAAPSRVLRALVRRTLAGTVALRSVDDPGDIDAIAAEAVRP